MAGRRAPTRRPTAFAQTPKVADPNTQRAFDVVQQAVLDLQARRHLEQFNSTEPGYVPESGGGEFDFLAADGTWKTIAGAGTVDSVTAGSAMVSVAPTTGNVVVDVVPSNFSGIPQSGVTFSGTNNRVSKFSGATLTDSTISDTGALVTVNSPINVTGAADFDSSVLVNGTLTANGAVDFDSTLDVDGAVNFDSTLTLSLMTPGSVLFAGTGGLVSQDNPKLFYDAPNDWFGIGTSSPTHPLTVVGSSLTHIVTVKNTNASGYSAWDFLDEAGAGVLGFGYSNAANISYISLHGGDLKITTPTDVQRVRVFNGGNVNIGPTATAPATALFRVEGVTQLGSLSTHTHTFNGFVGVNRAASSNDRLSIDQHAHVIDSSGVLRFVTDLGTNYIQSGTALTSDSKAALVFTSIFGVTEWMRISNAGLVTIQQGLTVLGNATLGNAVGDAHVINGTLDCNHAVNVDGALTATTTLGVTGLSTLTGGFTLGAASSAGSFKITSLANGSSAQDAAAFGQIATAVSAAVSGTTNTMAKFTGANAVGNSNITEVSSVARLARTTSDASFTVGDVSGSTGATDAYHIVRTFTDHNVYIDTKVGNAGQSVYRTGHNTEAGSTRTWMTVTASTGAVAHPGNVTLGNATTDRHATNGSMRNVLGDVGNMGAWGLTTWGDIYSVFGANAVSNTGSGVGIGYSTTSDMGVIVSAAPNTAFKPLVISASALDFRIGATTKLAVSAGGDTTVTGALSVTGNVTLGDAGTDAHIANGSISARGTGGASGYTAATGTVLTAENGGGTDAVISILSSGTKRLYFGNATSATDGAVDYDVAGGRGMRFRTAGTNWTTLSSAGLLTHTGALQVDGNVTLGDALTDSHTINGTTLLEGTPTATYGLYARTTQAGITTDGFSAVLGYNTGTFNTTAGALYNRGITGYSQATRSAGANVLTNIGVDAGASGAQTNIAVRADGSDYSFYGANGAIYNAGAVVAGGKYTGPAILANGWASDAYSLQAYRGASTIAAVNISGTADGCYFLYGADEHTYIRGGKAASQIYIGDATNTGGIQLGSATNNTFVAGQLIVDLATSLNGAVAIGNAGSDAHALLGTLNANSTAGSNGDVLTIVTGVPQWAAPAAGGGNVSTAGLTTDTIPKATGATTIGDSSFTDDGTDAHIGSNLALGSMLAVGPGYVLGVGGNVDLTGDLVITGALSATGTTQLGDASTDRVGIGTAPDSNHAMTFAAALGPKIALYPVSGTNAFGFGIQSAQLQYFVNSSTDYHSFGRGDSDSFTETHRLSANGDTRLGIDSTDCVGIGQAPDANHMMTFAGTGGGNIIALAPGSATSAIGFGLENSGGSDDGLRYYVYGSNNHHCFGHGDAGAFTETIRLSANGNLRVDGSATLGNAAGDAHALTGTLNANSTAGTAGQSLMVNPAGVPAWGVTAASITGAVAIANTETVVASYICAADELKAGTTFLIRAWCTQAGTNAATPTIRIRVGTTTLTGNIAATLTGAVGGSAVPSSFEGMITVRTAGAGGTVLGALTQDKQAVANAVNCLAATVAVNTTSANQRIELTFISGNAANTYSFQVATIFKITP